MSLVLVALAGLAGYWLWWSFVGRRAGLPPGPVPLPLLGNALSLDPKDMRASIIALRQKYGPVFTFWLGTSPMVMVCEAAEARKVFLGDSAEATADRGTVNVFSFFYRQPNAGIVNSSGPRWKETRRFSMQTLREFGVGRPLSEDSVRAEAGKMVEHLRDLVRQSPNGEINPSEAVNTAVISVISQLIYGWGLERGDADIAAIRSSVTQAQDAFVSPAAIMLQGYPWLRHVPLFGHFGYDAIMSAGDVIWTYIEGKIEEIKKAYDPASEPNCFVEAYLREAAQRRSAGKDVEPITDFNMSRTIGDFWVAGFETTVVTIRWTIAYLCMHPEVQAKAREEILAFYASKGGKDIEMGDRAALPYTAAVVTEAQRLANILPFNGQRQLSAPLNVGGHSVSSGTFVMPLLSCILFDEAAFPQPTEFRPERFLDSSGAEAKEAKEAFLPFSLGKRACAGESLARMELFIFTVALLRHFRLLPPKAWNDAQEGLAPSHDCLPGQIRKPTEYLVRLQEIAEE